jgi:hypothetical protein
VNDEEKTVSNHRQATALRPSLASIWFGALATLTTIALSIWVLWGPTMDSRHVMGCALGMLLATLMAAQTIVRAIDRDTARERQRRHQARLVAGQSPAEAVAARWPDPESDAYPQSPEDWPQPIEQPGPWQDREDTQRLTPPQRPSEAALTQIRVPAPGWPTEEDRQRWLAEQDATIISNPPDWRS